MSSNLPDPKNIPDMTLPERSQSPPSPAPVPDSTSTQKPPAPWEKSSAVGGWKLGDRVLAPWEPMFCYVGTIQEIDKQKALIQFDDGDAGWVDADQLRLVSVTRGQKVSSRRKMGPLFSPATIEQVQGDEVLVIFDDGSDEWTRIAALRFYREENDDTQGARPTKVASNKVFLEQLRRGDRVWAPWQPGVLFVGTVAELRDDKAHIRFDDGDEGWVQLEHLLPFEPRVGMLLMANWRGRGYFPGVITEVSGEQLHIRYDDGDQEWTTPRALALPSNLDAFAEPTKTVAHPAAGAGTGIPYWVIWVGISVLLLIARFACREMTRN